MPVSGAVTSNVLEPSCIIISWCETVLPIKSYNAMVDGRASDDSMCTMYPFEERENDISGAGSPEAFSSPNLSQPFMVNVTRFPPFYTLIPLRVIRPPGYVKEPLASLSPLSS